MLSGSLTLIPMNVLKVRSSKQMLTIGDQFPDYRLKAVVSADTQTAFTDVDNSTYSGKWQLVFFYPKDFTFVCPTEIKAFSDLSGEFADRDCQVMAASTDTEFVHLAWRQNNDDLKDLQIPMLADFKRELSSALGILHPEEGVAMRATFLVDPQGIIRYSSVTDMSVGRNPKEVLRVLDALQTDELCPCNWQPGDDVLQAA